MNSNNNNNNTSDIAQPPNAFDKWVSATPPATRFVLYIIVAFYLVTFISSNVIYTFSNVLLFVLHGEVWRPIFSTFFSNGIFSVLFIGLTFSSLGTRLERALGTLSFTHLIVSTAILSNIFFLLFCLLLAYNPIYPLPSALVWGSIGFWPVIMGLVVVECSIYPAATRQLLFFPVQIPTKYYPMALVAFFALFSFSWDLPIGTCVGYLRVYGWLKSLSPSNNLLIETERSGGGMFDFLTNAINYVSVNEALGGEIFNDVSSQNNDGHSNRQNTNGGDVETGGLGWGNRFGYNNVNDNDEQNFPGIGQALAASLEDQGQVERGHGGLVQSNDRKERARLIEAAALKRSKQFSQGGSE